MHTVIVVICLTVVLLSPLQADAQPTADETMSCSSSPQDIVEVAREIKNEIIRDVKTLCAASNPFDSVETSKRALVSALVSNCVPLLIQQNLDGSDFFNRSWAEFKVGFNDSRGNYWLGNDLLSQLTLSSSYKLKFDLQSRNNHNWYYAEYSTFIVLPETRNYKLQVAGFSGNAGHDAFAKHDGMMFSTYDNDNDVHTSWNCAARMGAGFWYKGCANCEVNSPRVGGADDFSWDNLPGGRELQAARMWLQCK